MGIGGISCPVLGGGLLPPLPRLQREGVSTQGSAARPLWAAALSPPCPVPLGKSFPCAASVSSAGTPPTCRCHDIKVTQGQMSEGTETYKRFVVKGKGGCFPSLRVSGQLEKPGVLGSAVTLSSCPGLLPVPATQGRQEGRGPPLSLPARGPQGRAGKPGSRVPSRTPPEDDGPGGQKQERLTPVPV